MAFDRRLPRGHVGRQRVPRRIVRCEQAFEAEAQRWVALAYRVQERGALLRRLLESRLEKGLFAG